MDRVPPDLKSNLNPTHFNKASGLGNLTTPSLPETSMIIITIAAAKVNVEKADRAKAAIVMVRGGRDCGLGRDDDDDDDDGDDES